MVYHLISLFHPSTEVYIFTTEALKVESHFARVAAYLNVDDDDEEDDDDTASSSPLQRTNWTELKERIFSGPNTGPDGPGPVWGNPRNMATRRYEKLPYGVHYDPEEEECRNVVLGNFTKLQKSLYSF